MRFPFNSNPVLVQNPQDKRFVNVAPLFDAMFETGNSKTLPTTEAMRDTIDDTIRFLNTCIDEESLRQSPGVVQRLNTELYVIMDMFSAIKTL